MQKLKADSAKAERKSAAFYRALEEQVGNVVAHMGSLPTLVQFVKPSTTRELKKAVDDRDIPKTAVLVLGLLSETVTLEHDRYLQQVTEATYTVTPQVPSIGHSPQYRHTVELEGSFENYLSPSSPLIKESFVSSGDDDYLRLMGESEEMLATIHAQSERIARLNQEICATMQSSKRLLGLHERASPVKRTHKAHEGVFRSAK